MAKLAEYVTVYDAALLRLPGWPLAAAGMVVALAGWLLGHAAPASRARGRGALALRVTRVSMLLLGAGWSVFIGVALLAQHARLRTALGGGAFTVVEGVVYDRPGGASGELHWMVDTAEGAHWYRYDGSPLAAGYTRRAPGTGGITNGVRVRIADVGGRIARLEAAPGGSAASR